MPSRKFSLEAGGPKNVEISWSGNWKKISIKVDDREIGTIPDKQMLNMGQQFALADGSRLGVRLTGGMSPMLEVTRNGRPLPGSDSDPDTKIKTAAYVIWFIAALNVIAGAIAVFGNVAFLLELGLDEFSIIFGVIFAVLGYFVMRRSLLALILAILLFVAATILSFVAAIQFGARPPISGMIVRFFLFLPMFQAIGAMRQPRD